MTSLSTRQPTNPPPLSEIRVTVGDCSLGSVVVAATEEGVCAILLGDAPDAVTGELRDRFPAARFIAGDQDLDRLAAKVVALIEAPSRGLDVALDIRGTDFQRQVWQALCEIPSGVTASYKDIAARIGAPKAVRAVARACASNALAVAIPCHRVVRGDGALSGYRWGVERKRGLLDREAAS